jgi:hypothetical protein
MEHKLELHNELDHERQLSLQRLEHEHSSKLKHKSMELGRLQLSWYKLERYIGQLL